MSEYEEITIDHKELLDKVLELKGKGYRLVQICSTKIPDGFELSYSFGQDYDFLNLKMKIDENTEISSISSIFEPAFLYENEMKDLFGVKINNITLDYKGNFYHTAVKTPFNQASDEKTEV